MKQLFAFLLMLTVLYTQAQQKNVFLDQAFWRTNPDVATIKSEIEKGGNPAEFNANSFDGVVMAIQAKAPTESVKFMIEQKGNEISKLTHDGRTYIFWALNAGDPALIEYLLQKGSKLDFEDSHGATPMTFSAGGQKNTAIYDLLIKHGANLKKEVNHEGANLILLTVAGDKDLVMTDYLISKGVDLKATDNEGNTAFSYAVRGGNIDQLKALVKRGVKYNSNAIFMVGQGGGRGPAAAAPAQGPLELFRYFDELGINPNTVNKNGENLLHTTLRRPNQIALVNFLISKGVDINLADKEGNTPIMNAAATNRDTAMIDAVLPMVKNINQVNSKGLSALSMAVRTNGAPVISRLIDKGADLKVEDSNGDDLAFYLMQSYNPRNAAEFSAKVGLLKSKGFDITAPQQNGNTLYHLAIAKNDLDLLKSLEVLKVDVNAKNKEGLTVLHKAAMTAKNDAILKYLISIGARKDITTDLKETVFDLASENEYLAKNKTTIDFLK